MLFIYTSKVVKEVPQIRQDFKWLTHDWICAVE